MSAISRIDLSAWPIVHFHMPERVEDGDADAQLAEFETLLARGERFVLLTSGPMMPAKSKHFMKLYGAWSKRSRDLMGRLCAGSVRLEPDPQKRGAFVALVMTFIARTTVPYPVAVAASMEEAMGQARQWLASDRER